MTSDARTQRLIDEFEDGATWHGDHSIRHGLARVLRHLIDTEASINDEGSWYAVSATTLWDLAEALEAPTLVDRALDGDATAARQFLYEAGFTDKQGHWLPQYQPPQETHD
jgi:hypothetical protein